jgi:hypothetical protein
VTGRAGSALGLTVRPKLPRSLAADGDRPELDEALLEQGLGAGEVVNEGAGVGGRAGAGIADLDGEQDLLARLEVAVTVAADGKGHVAGMGDGRGASRGFGGEGRVVDDPVVVGEVGAGLADDVEADEGLSVGDLVGLAGVEVDAQGVGEAGVPAHHVEAEVAGLGLAGLDVADQQLDAVELVARAVGEHVDAVDGGGTVVADLDPQGEGVAGADLPGLDDAGDEAEARGGAYLAADLALPVDLGRGDRRGDRGVLGESEVAGDRGEARLTGGGVHLADQLLGDLVGDADLGISQGRRALAGRAELGRAAGAGEVAQLQALGGSGGGWLLVLGGREVRDLGGLAAPLEALAVVVVGDAGDVGELDGEQQRGRAGRRRSGSSGRRRPGTRRW